MRLIYLERPHLLGPEQRCAIDGAVRKRLLSPLDATAPWRSIPVAQQDLETLLAGDLEGDALANQLRYSKYLKERADALTEHSRENDHRSEQSDARVG